MYSVVCSVFGSNAKFPKRYNLWYRNYNKIMSFIPICLKLMAGKSWKSKREKTLANFLNDENSIDYISL